MLHTHETERSYVAGCPDCAILNRIAHRRLRKVQELAHRVMFWGYKLVSGCVDCGYNLHDEALDFDHVRGTKLREVSRMLHFSWTRIMKEVAKCEVVCANCHRIRTAGRRVTKPSTRNNLPGPLLD